jgi:CRISPR/Cas system CSM-associated protein Csm5 (group 7 of RAMP superfamily)
MLHRNLKPGVYLSAISLFFFFNTQAQTTYTDKISEWKTSFPKEEVVAPLLKEVVDFTLNSSAAAGEAKVKATVSSETVLVPVKDFIKFDDGLFYDDETSVENVKALNPDKKEVTLQKLCGDYSSENIFHSDAKLCVVKFPL